MRPTSGALRPAAGRPGARLHHRDPAGVPVPARPRACVYCDFKPDNMIQVGDARQADRPRRRAPRSTTTSRRSTARSATRRPRSPTVGPTVASRHLHDRPHPAGAAHGVPRLPVDLRRLAAAGRRRRRCSSEHDSLYRLLLKACAPDPADRFASADELRVQLLGVLREVVAATARRGTAPTSASSLLFEAPAVVRATALDWQHLPAPARRHDRPAGRLAAERQHRATRAQRLAELERRPAVDRRGAAGRGAAPPSRPGSSTRVDAAADAAARRRPVGVAGASGWRAWSPLQRGRLRRRRSARSTRSTGRCPASWRPSWRWRSPARPAASPTSPSASTRPAPATDANYVAPAAFGLARIRSRPRATLRRCRPRARPGRRRPAGRSPRPDASAPGCSPASGGGLAVAGRGAGQHRGLTIDPVDRAALRVDGARGAALDVVQTNGRGHERCSSAGVPAAEPSLRDGLEAAYRDAGRERREPRGAGAPRRPGQRGAPLDAAMTATAR